MNILFNATPLLTPLTGIGQYVLQLFTALQTHHKIHLFSYYPNKLENGLYLPHYNALESADDPQKLQNQFQKNLVHFLTKIPFQRDIRHFVEPYIFKKRCQTLPEGTIYHEPSFVCFPFDGPKVVSVCDLSTFDCPEMHPKSRVRFLEKGMPQTLKEAEKIFVISHFTQERLQHWFKVDHSKIICTHLGARWGFYPRNEFESVQFLKKYNLKSKTYILSIGTLEPRKNLNTLFAAFSKLPQHLQERYPLVVVGKDGWLEKGIVQSAMPLVEKGLLRFLGFVPDVDLPFLLSQAKAFSYPSLYEGFGLPVLEALSCGVPTVASNATSIPEVAGDAALLHEAENVDALCQHLQNVLENEELAQSLIQKGLGQAKKFSWQQCAQQTFEAYRQILKC